MTDSREPLRVVLAGAGRMGRNHLRVIREHSEFFLYAVVDPNGVPSDLAGDATVVGRVEELDDEAYDCAVVATPTNTHYAVAEALLVRGKHLLVEKPLAATYRECLRLIQIAEEKRACLAVGHVERFNPAVRKLREVLAAGWLGCPTHFSLMRAGHRPDAMAKGNDVLLNLAVHDLDILRWIAGPVRMRAAICQATLEPGVCDRADMSLLAQSGPSATIHANWMAPVRTRNLQVTGTRAACHIDYLQQTCKVFGEGQVQAAEEGGPHLRGYAPDKREHVTSGREIHATGIELGVEKEEPLRSQLDQFGRLVSMQEWGDLCRASDAAAAVRLAEDALKRGWKRAQSPETANTVVDGRRGIDEDRDEWI